VRTLIAALALLALAAPANADYRRVAQVAPSAEAALALAGNELYVGTTLPGVSSTVTAYGIDGGKREVALPGDNAEIEYMSASTKALAILTIKGGRNGFHSYYGSPRGPFRPIPGHWRTVAVTGSRVLTLYDVDNNPEGSGYVLDRPVSGHGKSKRIRISVPRIGVMAAAGNYVGALVHFASPRQTLYVADRRTGREAYRVPDVGSYVLLPSGRAYFLRFREDPYADVMTATPSHPKPIRLAHLSLHRAALAASEDHVAVVAGHRQIAGQVTLIGLDKRQRTITPRLPRLEAIEYDGRTLAFQTGNCVFIGPPRSGGADTAGCFSEPG
jgi:hypothetical protein